MIEEDLDSQQLKTIGSQEIAIWHTPDGEVYVDGEFFFFFAQNSMNMQSFMADSFLLR
jgi:hypothetical protein